MTFVDESEYRKPLIISKSGLRDLKLKKGDVIEETVVFTADPKPEILWFKDGKPLQGTEALILKTEVKDLENGLKQYTCSLNVAKGKYKTLYIYDKFLNSQILQYLYSRYQRFWPL